MLALLLLAPCLFSITGGSDWHCNMIIFLFPSPLATHCLFPQHLEMNFPAIYDNNSLQPPLFDHPSSINIVEYCNESTTVNSHRHGITVPSSVSGFSSTDKTMLKGKHFFLAKVSLEFFFLKKECEREIERGRVR